MLQGSSGAFFQDEFDTIYKIVCEVYAQYIKVLEKDQRQLNDELNRHEVYATKLTIRLFFSEESNLYKSKIKNKLQEILEKITCNIISTKEQWYIKVQNLLEIKAEKEVSFLNLKQEQINTFLKILQEIDKIFSLLKVGQQDSQFFLGLLYLEKNNYKDAIELLKPVFQRLKTNIEYPQGTQGLFIYSLLLGRCHEFAKDFLSAKEYYGFALQHCKDPTQINLLKTIMENLSEHPISSLTNVR